MTRLPLLHSFFSLKLTTSALLCLSLLTGCGSDDDGPAASSSSGASSSQASSSSLSSSAQSSEPTELSRLSTDGTQWVNAQGEPVILRGTNLGNWLLQEFWMMGQSTEAVNDQCTLEAVLDERFGQSERERLMELFRDNWVTERDWDQIAEFGLNVVRLPFIWNLIEDENEPYTLRDDAWHYLDQAIAEAEERGIYVILDLHGAAGSQGWEHHSGCAERNWYWDGGNGETADYYQDRTIWLWKQIAERYQDNDTVAAYGLLNEPWGTTPETLAEVITTLYGEVRAVDPNHVIILPGHSAGIDAYGNPADHGMTNVAFEMHFYPGIFGWGEIGYDVHRDWLTCGPEGTTGVCEWDARLDGLDTPFLIGEFQPWTGLGLEQGAKIARATYDTYGQYDWAATNWAYKVLTNTGGQGAGTWGMVTNQKGLGLLTKADTWACAGWDSDFDEACGTATPEFTVPGEGEQTYYLVIKAGACCDGTLDVSVDSLSLHSPTQDNRLANGAFGSDEGWTTWTVGESISADFNAETGPAGGDGAALRLTGTSDSNGGFYQAVTLQGGETYQFDGVFKDHGSASAWTEIYLVQSQPEDGIDITGEVLPQIDFNAAPLEDIEALFESFGQLPYDVHEPLRTWLNADQSPELFDLPPAPGGLSLTPVDAGQQLTWNASTDERVTGYRVYRSTVADATGEAIADVDTASYTDTDTASQTRYYRVSALAGAAGSYPSEAVATEVVATALPGQWEAEHYTAMSGIQLETTSDTDGGQNIGHFEAGDWLEYTVDIAAAGTYAIDYRLASDGGSDGFEVRIGEDILASVAVPDTGGWQSWQTVTGEITLPAGEHTLRVQAVAGSWNLNWLNVSPL